MNIIAAAGFDFVIIDLEDRLRFQYMEDDKQ